jgi:phosphoglycerol transferase MdoB-like AlkP superfamily enzyme
MNFLKKNKKLFIILICLVGIFFSYLILDVSMRYLLWKNIGFVSYKSFSPLAFSISYVLFLLFIIIVFPKVFKPTYIITVILSNLYFLAQMIHIKILGNFFSMTSLFSAGEGMHYLGYALSNIDIRMILIMLLSIISLIVVLLIIKKSNVNIFDVKKKILWIIIIVILLFLSRFAAIYKLGKPVAYYEWNTWDIPRNIYDSFNNKNRGFMVSGMYEYAFRDIYLYTKNILNPKTKENIKEINDYIDNLDYKIEKNDYSNIFKDKNLIMIMFESIDTWMITEDVMPTLYKLQKEGLNFTNRYAPFYGGAMTINSEFASLTSLYSVITDKAIYNYDENSFKYSLPNLFKQNGYIVNSIHKNNGLFYNRTNFHKALGFENHYALFNMDIVGRFEYDSQVALNDETYRLMTPNGKFMTFFTTYSTHVPYTDSAMCKEIENDHKELKIKGNEELTCIRILANDTDEFLNTLIKKLEKDKLIDNMVLVMFSDHYAYGYSDEWNVKNAEDGNLIQRTPFIIWSKDIKHKDIDTISDTADIPVILFNMFGIEYNPKIYMGTDIFSNNHEKFVYFSDYSWYDGDYYSKNGGESDYIKNVSSIVNKKIDINQKIISSDFYKNYAY